MDDILNFIKSDIFNYVMAGTMFFMLILFIIGCLGLGKINKKYKTFMKKLGNGNNVDEMLREYINKVEKVENSNQETNKYLKTVDKVLETCLKKVGMVRYNAFKDTGSNLSFALALLDDNDNGIILNGIYSREMSNVYAKQVERGQVANNLTEEEQEALRIAKRQFDKM